MARIQYGVGRYDAAGHLYGQVPQDSDYWAESVYEHAWADFRGQRAPQSMGHLLTLTAPAIAEREHLPEADIVHALVEFSLCRYDEVNRVLDRFEGRYEPLRDGIREVLGQPLDDAELYREFFVDPGTDLDKPLAVRILRNADLRGVVHHLGRLETELVHMAHEKRLWQDTVGAHLEPIYARDRARYEGRAGKIVRAELSRHASVLSDLLAQADVIRFEAVDGQRVVIEDVIAGRRATPLAAPHDYALDRERIYWPWNGEFWEDELDTYEVFDDSQCGREPTI
jgi:hypothetical protein